MIIRFYLNSCLDDEHLIKHAFKCLKMYTCYDNHQYDIRKIEMFINKKRIKIRK